MDVGTDNRATLNVWVNGDGVRESLLHLVSEAGERPGVARPPLAPGRDAPDVVERPVDRLKLCQGKLDRWEIDGRSVDRGQIERWQVDGRSPDDRKLDCCQVDWRHIDGGQVDGWHIDSPLGDLRRIDLGHVDRRHVERGSPATGSSIDGRSSGGRSGGGRSGGGSCPGDGPARSSRQRTARPARRGRAVHSRRSARGGAWRRVCWRPVRGCAGCRRCAGWPGRQRRRRAPRPPVALTTTRTRVYFLVPRSAVRRPTRCRRDRGRCW